MKRLVACAIVLIFSSVGLGGGFASNENFIVRTAGELGQTADSTFAKLVVTKAEEYRRSIAKEWIKDPIPDGVGRTYLTVSVTTADKGGSTWPKNDLTGEYHNVHLHTTREESLGGTLAHEIAHVVLETRYQGSYRLPVWVAEGIASRYDGKSRINQRDEILKWYCQTGNWPDIKHVLNRQNVRPNEKANYAVAASLCEFLLSRGDKFDLIEFAIDSKQRSCDQSLETTYGIRDVEQLQQLWRSWASNQYRGEQR